jgi:hypothetical protein
MLCYVKEILESSNHCLTYPKTAQMSHRTYMSVVKGTLLKRSVSNQGYVVIARSLSITTTACDRSILGSQVCPLRIMARVTESVDRMSDHNPISAHLFNKVLITIPPTSRTETLWNLTGC